MQEIAFGAGIEAQELVTHACLGGENSQVDCCWIYARRGGPWVG